MSFDYYTSLAKNTTCPKKASECALASGFVDGCTTNFSFAEMNGLEKDKNEIRQCYINRAKGRHDFPEELKNLRHEPDFSNLPDSNWFGIEVKFTLQSPWYSKDDRAFHVMDNPVRKDRVFGVPFMSAASWKGLLRWACRMQCDLYKHLEKNNMKMTGWQDPNWIVHLFGNEKGEEDDFRSGTLVFYPTWFKKIGFEVINPHDRAHRAGTQPIYYEVVPAGAQGTLRLLYAPLPGEIERDMVKPDDFIDNLVDNIQALLETYGFSAKRTAGWGMAKIKEKGWKLYPENGNTFNTANEVKQEIKKRFASQGGSR